MGATHPLYTIGHSTRSVEAVAELVGAHVLFPIPLSPAKAGVQAFCLMPFFVYRLASRRNGTLYLGYTDGIFRRVSEHKAHSLGGFTAEFRVEPLVWFETDEPRQRLDPRTPDEKWRRACKLEPIERFNPTWGDPFEGLA